ncbi:hypothetical protein [Sphingobium sp. SCG-1]|uniref:hypothetical protein n=1 Tax=Sphingobium sp. SCG-1 TaxID=2072936 RepID=UPI00166FA3A1|nr:hypothetical protein [Sphingobium sp. SCG-1]
MDIDGPTLMGFAAVLTSITNLISVVQRMRRERHAETTALAGGRKGFAWYDIFSKSKIKSKL